MGLPRLGALRRLVLSALLLTLLVPAEAAVAATSSAPHTPAVATTPQNLTVGSTAVVRADGDCLRLRSAAAVSASVLTCLAEGTLVTVLEGRVSADGYYWQKIQAGSVTGWAAEMYLRAAVSAPVAPPPTGCVGSSIPVAAQAPVAPQPTPVPEAPAPPPAEPPPAPVIGGDLPQAGGIGLVVWSGGPVTAVATAAEAGGCQPSSIWVTDAEGNFLGFIFGAPEVVNQAWQQRFQSDLAANTPLIIVCEAPASSLAITLSIENPTLVPAAWGPEPVAAHVVVPPTTSAAAAVMIDAASGKVLYEKNGHRALPPASLTKIATAILAVENGNLDNWVKVDVDARNMPGSSVMGLRAGDCFRMRDLLYGLMLPSGNDAALAISRHQSGSDGAFVSEMNALLGRLGLRNTQFRNPHGLSESGHYASAYDLAMLARYAMTLPDFVPLAGTRQWSAQGSRTINMNNVNSFLGLYPGADGVKTGFTEDAGRTLVASVTRNGRRVYVALMNAPRRDDDARVLFDWAFQTYVWG